MIHLAAAMVLLVLTHIFCLATMTERKYSIRKTALIYAVFAANFIGLTAIVFALFGSSSADTAFISFTSTIIVSFFVFILTSTDAFSKKLFCSSAIRICSAYSSALLSWCATGCSPHYPRQKLCTREIL